MKLTWQTAFKAFIALFWVTNISLLLYGAMSSSKGIANHLLGDFMSQFFLIIGILGILSVIVEIFYKNIIYKYFVLSFLLVSYFFFFRDYFSVF
ncbi:hypothetical protein LS70_009780 [Helicobacter sp. MIT 11-5569]|uniref:hypothetical protein n=1 Tax=Helicobacter sp. MIT 11-5569 TaxID=1548151 RepID=UPI00051FD44F|nr:hypothetical protein [Helicobacter sp. MIT 11-5569]TLD79683.1 hypothetical protein LS70_009780 [Helicobacter sp. MIT 11-5569]